MEFLLEAVVMRELHEYLESHYSKEEIKKRGLETDDDIKAVLKEYSHLNMKDELILDEYIKDQTIKEIFDFDDDGNLVKGRD